MAPNLSFETQRRVDMMYPEERREEATRLLGLLSALKENERIKMAALNVLIRDDVMISEIERLQFAALKVSNGDVNVLTKATKVAQLDWRDLLVAAGFGEPSKHKSWLPKGMGPQQEGGWTRMRKRMHGF